jgi:hypothetical protein
MGRDAATGQQDMNRTDESERETMKGLKDVSETILFRDCVPSAYMLAHNRVEFKTQRWLVRHKELMEAQTWFGLYSLIEDNLRYGR